MVKVWMFFFFFVWGLFGNRVKEFSDVFLIGRWFSILGCIGW